jgi:hypothetical protein
MADLKISELTQNPSITGAEEMPTERGGSNYKNTLTALKVWLQSVLTFLSSGDDISNLTNDVGYITSAPVDSVNGETGLVVLDKTDIGLGAVDNTSDANKPISTATQTALDLKEDDIVATTSADYYRGDKTFQTLNKAAVGFGNVDNTTDLLKPISTATKTYLVLKSNKATIQVSIASTTKTVATTDSETSFNLFGAGALSVWTLDVGSLIVGEGFEVNLGDADGISFVAGAGANINGLIAGSTTLGDAVFVRRLADDIFGLTGEVYKIY